jgi:hypothetical protein
MSTPVSVYRRGALATVENSAVDARRADMLGMP